MIQQRDFWITILLSIVTCGIYGVYFWYKYAQDMNVVCAGDGDETQDYLIAFLLGLVTLGIYTIYWFYKVGNRLQANAPRYGMAFQENGTTILLWMLLGVLICGVGTYYAWYLMIKNMNAVANVYNQGGTPQPQPPQQNYYPPAGTYPPQQ